MITKIVESRDTTCPTMTSSTPVSVVYTGGIIRPLISGVIDKVDAIGFHCGQVVASGTKSHVICRMNALGIQYTVCELSSGQTLIPGMIEPHMQIVPPAFMMGWKDLSFYDGQNMKDNYNIEWLKQQICSVPMTALTADPSTTCWILGRGVEPSIMPFQVVSSCLNKLQRLDCDVVDSIRNDVPVLMISSTMHTGYVNTKALCEIYRCSEEIQSEFPTFNQFRDHVNKNGGLQETELIFAFAAIPKQQMMESLLCLGRHLDCTFETAVRQGVTLVYDAMTTPLTKKILDMYFRSRNQRVRIGYGLFCETLEDAEALEPYQPPTDICSMYAGSIKIVADGSNSGLTAYQNEPYRCEPPNNCGAFNIPPFSHPEIPAVEFTKVVKTIIDKGWPTMIHTSGDKTTEIAIATLKDVLNGCSGLEKRHRLEQCTFTTDETISAMASLGISPSYTIGHVGYWGHVFRNAIFEEKAEKMYRVRSAIDKGIRVSLQSDCSVTPISPLRVMEQAITRRMEADPKCGVLNKCERITPKQALKAVTYDAAWQCQADKWVGSLENGKMADFVILNEDPITRKNPVGMRNINVLETWVGGVRMYSSGCRK